MPIIFHEKTKTFHLYNDQISYLFKVAKNGHLINLYFGQAISDKEDFDYLLETNCRAMSVCTYEDDVSFSMEHLRQEYPCYGNGDMHTPSFDLLQENGSRLCDFTFHHYQIIDGKPDLHPLPHVYCEFEHEMTTLEVVLEDALIETTLKLYFTIDEKRPVIMRSVNFHNHGTQTLRLDRAMSLSIDLPDAHYDWIELTGAWARERYMKTRPLNHGITAIQSLRGTSSNNFNPFIALKRPETTEHQGTVIGFSLIYSGNFLAMAEVDTYEVCRVMLGIHPQNFSWQLEPNTSFQTPEAVMVFSQNGLNGMSQTYHDLYRQRLARGYWRDRPAPLLVNNWEATYFNFNEEKIMEIAKEAKNLGLELFVLDDGWFGHRNDDTTSLGDWYPNQQKLPLGIAHLSRKIEELGLKFGLWIEPEMVNLDSDLYREHPEWRLSTPSRKASHGRHQYILDFSNPQVVDYIFNQIDRILSEAKISYIKWDMNRCMSEVYSVAWPASHQGEIMHRYILGVYDLYDRLTSKYPEILFESCASGGARFDPGMLYYAPQAWTSDDTDAVERLKIQYGTSMVYPLRSMGSHVSASPNHQLDRVTNMKMRAEVAYFGTFGYELDLTKLSEEDKKEAKDQIAWMKKHRQLLQFGTFYRLKSPFDGNVTCWMVVSSDRKEAIVGWYRVLNQINVGYERIGLKGLDPHLQYTINNSQRTYGGDELMYIGLITSDHTAGEKKPSDPRLAGDFTSRIFYLKAE